MFEITAVRVFYRKLDKKIVWYHSLAGAGEFPTTVEEDLAELPNKPIDPTTTLGGTPADYVCIEELDPVKAQAILASDDNKIVNGKLIIGAPRPPPAPPPEPLHFSNPSFTILDFPGVEQRVENIETFLKALYP